MHKINVMIVKMLSHQTMIPFTGQNTEFHPQLQQQKSHASASSQLGKQLQGLDTAVALPPVRPEHSPSTIQSTEGDLYSFWHRVCV